MDKKDKNSLEIQIQYRMVEKLTEMNRKLQEEIEIREKSEKALKESEQKYRQIIEEASDIIYRVDKEGYFTYVNKVALKVTGKEEKDLIGKHFFSLIRKDYKKKALTFYANVLDKCIHSSYWEFPLNIDADKEIWIGQNVTLLGDNGQVTSIQAVARDITERIEYQRELIKAKEMAEEAVKIKSQFLANMSHEIRTPINGIMGLTNLLINNTKVTDKQQEYLNAIVTSSDVLMVVINDILDISKIDAGKLTIEKKNFKVKDIISALLEVFNNKATEKGLLLNVKIDEKLPDILVGDVTRLNQILYNLLGNGIKFTKEGKVELTVKVKKKSESNMGVEFIVSDTGIGIPKSKLPSIFSAFIQANGDTTRKFGGTGLGLTIVKKLVELQGGNITVESTPKGSVFTVMIDYETGQNILKESTSIGCNNCDDFTCINRLNILLVEDNLINQIVTKDLLNDKGCNIKVVNNGKEAIEILASEDFDLILMDMQMPVMDGYQAMTYIRNEMAPNKQDIPILALTAHVIEGEVEKCKKTGANDYLSKPFTPKALFHKVVELTSRTCFSVRKASLKQVNKSEEKVADLMMLRDFTNGKDKLMISTIHTLIEEIPNDLELMLKASNEKDWEKLRSVSHRTKPNFMLIAGDKLKKEILKIEEYARERINLEQLPRLLKKIKQNISFLVEELKEEVIMLETKNQIKNV